MLPETTRTRIEREADEYAKDAPDNRCFELCEGYIAGATAEAEFNRIAYDELREKAQRLAEDAERWKRAYEELEKKYKSDQEAWELINEAYQHLKIGFESAEKMADALESVKEDTEVIIEVYPTLAPAKTIINTIDNALQQWRGEK